MGRLALQKVAGDKVYLGLFKVTNAPTKLQYTLTTLISGKYII